MTQKKIHKVRIFMYLRSLWKYWIRVRSRIIRTQVLKGTSKNLIAQRCRFKIKEIIIKIGSFRKCKFNNSQM